MTFNIKVALFCHVSLPSPLLSVVVVVRSEYIISIDYHYRMLSYVGSCHGNNSHLLLTVALLLTIVSYVKLRRLGFFVVYDCRVGTSHVIIIFN